MSYAARRETVTAVSASISTPVRAWTRTVAVARRPEPSGAMSTSTSIEDSGSGWQRGSRSAVRLAAWIPAILATTRGSPFGVRPARRASMVAGLVRRKPSATAVRRVGSLSETSTIRGRPASSWWVSLWSIAAVSSSGCGRAPTRLRGGGLVPREGTVQAREQPGKDQLGVDVAAGQGDGLVHQPNGGRGGAGRVVDATCQVGEEVPGVGVDEVLLRAGRVAGQIPQPARERLEHLGEAAAGAGGGGGVGGGVAGGGPRRHGGLQQGAGALADGLERALGAVLREEAEGAADRALGEGGDPGRLPGRRAGHLGEEGGDLGVRQRSQRDREQPRANGRQQVFRVGGGEDERDVRRRLLEQLEQGVRRLGARVLGDQVFRLADQEDLAAAEGGPGDGHAGEGPDLRQVEADGFIRRGDPEAGPGAFRQLVGARLLERSRELVRPRGALRPRQREEPLEVRVLQPDREPAVLAGAAGLLARRR